MTDHDDDPTLRDAIHRAYDVCPTPIGMHGRVTAGLREAGPRRRLPRLRGWATGLAVAGVLAGVVGAATIERHLGGGSSPAPVAVAPAGRPTPSPSVAASPVGAPTGVATATATAVPTAAPHPTATPLPPLPHGPGWQQQWAGTSNDLTAVDFVDTLHGWVVGAGGTILTTWDGGAHWMPQRSGVTAVLSSVSFVDRMHGWVVGAGDTVLSTSNGGTTWTLGHTGTGAQLNEVDFVDASDGWVVTGAVDPAHYMALEATTDGGRHWAPVTPAGTVTAVHFADRLHGWTDNAQTIKATVDGGSTWTTVTVDGWWDQIGSTDSAHAYAMHGSAPFVTTTGDGGTTWTSHAVSGLGDLWGIAATDPDHLWVVGGTLGASSLPGFATSSDGGATWAEVTLTTPAQQTPTALVAVDPSDLWVVGKGGLIIKLTGATAGAR